MQRRSPVSSVSAGLPTGLFAPVRLLVVAAFLASMTACPGCPPPTPTDAGPDGGIDDAGTSPEVPEPDGGGPIEPEGDASVGPLCDENF